MSSPSSAPNESTPRIRRSTERGLQKLGWSTNRMTFSFGDYHDSNWMHFGPLRVLIESRIEPNSGFPEHPHRHVEILSYVTNGVLRHTDSYGHVADVTTGEMQLISAGRRGMIHNETNPLDRAESHYQMWLVPDRAETEFAYHELKPPAEERRGEFRCYVSPNGYRDTMPVNTDAYVYAGVFSPADRSSHTLPPERGAWVQTVDGTVSVNGITLHSGDGAGFTSPSALKFSFEEPSEVLLIDVRMDAPRIWE